MEKIIGLRFMFISILFFMNQFQNNEIIELKERVEVLEKKSNGFQDKGNIVIVDKRKNKGE